MEERVAAGRERRRSVVLGFKARAADRGFLYPRRRSGERTEERGCSFRQREKRFLAPALSCFPRQEDREFFGGGCAALCSFAARNPWIVR